MLTHELRNQIVVIEGFATTMLQNWESMPSEQQLDLLERVTRNAHQMHALVDAFSDVHKVENETFEISRLPTDLDRLVGDITTDLIGLGSHHIELAVKDQVVVEVDPVRIRQVLTNLLSNAAKFAPPSSTIHVSVDMNEHYAEIVVSDEGPGVPDHLRDELFRPFSRLGVEDKEGAGLGLYISRGIARAHGGDLFLAPGSEGACFVMILPLVA
ncbi:MAG: hypothetical protein H0U53_04850 [Actinobacteria bacterium]|nr:hypothetical protein [Actinomycetota bacterium]